MELKQFIGLQVFEFAYLMALAFLPFFVAQREVGLTIMGVALIYAVISVIKAALTKRISPNNKLVLITGCDTGSGFGTVLKRANQFIKQRILGFVMCILLGTFCLSLASLYLPMLLLKARKFVVLYTLGSVFIISSFSFLWGPYNHMKHLFSAGRLPFTTAYFGTMFATIYFSMWIHSTVLTVICAVGQIITLVWYVVSYIPGGQTGLKFFSNILNAVAPKAGMQSEAQTCLKANCLMVGPGHAERQP